MKQRKLVLLAVSLILLSGFVIPLFMDDLIACTKKYCSCSGNKDELECNSCSIYNPVYLTILVNVGYNCQAKEVIICENNEQKDVRYDKNECNYVWNSIFTEINRNDGIVIFE